MTREWLIAWKGANKNSHSLNLEKVLVKEKSGKCFGRYYSPIAWNFDHQLLLPLFLSSLSSALVPNTEYRPG